MLVGLDPLTRAALEYRPPKMSPDEAEAIVRRRWAHHPCDLLVGYQVMMAREAGAPLVCMPPLRLPGPLTREANEREVESRRWAREDAPALWCGIEKVLAAKRAAGVG